MENHRIHLAARVDRVQGGVGGATETEQLRGARPVDGQWHTVTRRGAQRALVVQRESGEEQVEIVQQPLAPGRGPEADRRGHGGLEMGSPRHGDPRVAPPERDQRPGESGGFLDRAQKFLARIYAQRGGDLIVPASGGVDALAGVAQPPGQRPLDREMAVLVFRENDEPAGPRGLRDPPQFDAHLPRLGPGQDRTPERQFRQHDRMGGRAETVGGDQRAIKFHVAAGRVGQDIRVNVADRGFPDGLGFGHG